MRLLEKIEFISQREAESWIGRKDEAIISVTPRETESAELPGEWHDILRLSFHDVEQAWAGPGHVLFAPEQAEAVWGFVERLPSSIRVLCIHCHYGISRSGALALAICERFGLAFDGEEKECNAHVLDLMRKARDGKSE